jgi:NAD binding domain of 6-phosphogluconate dehydrogenase
MLVLPGKRVPLCRVKRAQPPISVQQRGRKVAVATSLDSATSMNVGVVGMGIMGAPMAENLLKSGKFDSVTVWNRTISKVPVTPTQTKGHLPSTLARSIATNLQTHTFPTGAAWDSMTMCLHVHACLNSAQLGAVKTLLCVKLHLWATAFGGLLHLASVGAFVAWSEVDARP